MKFVAPEIEVKKFDLDDILTVSGEGGGEGGNESGTDVCTPDL